MCSREAVWRLEISDTFGNCDVCLLPSSGQQVRPDQERAGDVEHQSAGPDPPGNHHCGGRPLPFHVHPRHPH